MAITPNEVIELGNKWASILELGDWQIWFTTQDKIFNDYGVELSGQCEPNPRSLQAKITISTIDGNEETIIHELLHVITSELAYEMLNSKPKKLGKGLHNRINYHDERVVTRLGRVLVKMEVKPDGN